MAVFRHCCLDCWQRPRLLPIQDQLVKEPTRWRPTLKITQDLGRRWVEGISGVAIDHLQKLRIAALDYAGLITAAIPS
jgi:cell division inhibitor SulA